MQWLKPPILATWGAEIRRTVVQGQLRQKVLETLSQVIAGQGGMLLSSQLRGEAEIVGLGPERMEIQ
jgi:hypothetical protein